MFFFDINLELFLIMFFAIQSMKLAQKIPTKLGTINHFGTKGVKIRKTIHNQTKIGNLSGLANKEIFTKKVS